MNDIDVVFFFLMKNLETTSELIISQKVVYKLENFNLFSNLTMGGLT